MLDLDPGPYAAYIWPAYGLTALVFGLPLLLAFNQARRTARPSAPR